MFAPALNEEFRASVYRMHGATTDETSELLAYARSPYAATAQAMYPLPDEPFVEAWEAYVEEAARIGAAASLAKRLIQLRFPIALGMSADESYRAATRRGVVPPNDQTPLLLRKPEKVVIIIHPTAAGRIALIVSGDREDFESLVRSLTRRNEPDPIPASVGACMVAGYNNWDRIAAWRAVHGGMPDDRARYQDRFIVLSTGPYSGVRASSLGLTDADWRAMSLVIRREHECAHYFTRRAFGTMRNTLIDEILADYAGLVAGAGRFRGDWFLRFLGLEHDGTCRPDGRIHSYRGAPPLSEGAFAVLRAVVVGATAAVEAYDATLPPGPRSLACQASVITTLARVGLEGLVSDDAPRLLRETADDVAPVVT